MCSGQVALPARTYRGFHSVKQQEVLLLPSGYSQGRKVVTFTGEELLPLGEELLFSGGKSCYPWGEELLPSGGKSYYLQGEELLPSGGRVHLTLTFFLSLSASGTGTAAAVFLHVVMPIVVGLLEFTM